MSLSPEEQAMFGGPAVTSATTEDDWGFDEPVTPAPAARVIGKLNFTDESTQPDAAVKAARDSASKTPVPTVTGTSITNGVPMSSIPSTTAAAVLPPDAPKADANTPPPEKAKRGAKAKDAAYLPLVETGRGHQVVELGPESMAVLRAILAALTAA